MIADTPIIAAKRSPELLEYLLHRRSCPLKLLKDPGPSDEQIEAILRAAARIPDHGKLAPWHFIVFRGNARKKAGEFLKSAFAAQNPEAVPEKLELEAGRFLLAPVVIAVISRIKEGKTPEWEQILSAGAACMNLCLAANALGFGTNWLTDWPAYSDVFKKSIGLNETDRIAGLIYIGTPSDMPSERPRPEMKDVITYWA